MNRELLFLFTGAAVGAGAMMLLDRARGIEEIRRSSTEPRGFRSDAPAAESPEAGLEAMDEEDLETPYSGYSGT